MTTDYHATTSMNTVELLLHLMKQQKLAMDYQVSRDTNGMNLLLLQ